jgi:hypothetical protein
MPVDRARRNAAADALESFLRGQIGRDAFGEMLERLLPAANARENAETVHDSYLDNLIGDRFLFEWYGPICEETWLGLCRHLAFLNTDLEEKPFGPHHHEDEDRPRQILLARWHTLGLLVALGVSYLVSWWLFASATLLSFLLYQVSMWKHDSLVAEEGRTELQQRFEYYPFADESEWLAHKHHLDQYLLPAYDATAFRDPRQARKWLGYLLAPVRAGCFLIIVAMFVYVYAFSVVLWPLWLVMMSLCRREPERQQLTP